MTLITQIQSLSMSFMYGIFFSLMFNIMYKFLFTKNVIINIITNLLFVFAIFSLYFYFLYIINGGIVHIYFVVVLILGFLIYNRVFVKIRVK